MDPSSDASLISRVILDDDHKAFDELIRRYQSDVRVLLRKLTQGDEALADDLAQETFIRVYRYLKGYTGAAKFSTCMYRIAYNVFKSQYKHTNHHELLDEDSIKEMDCSSEENIGLRVDLDIAMSNLKAVERAALMLSYKKGMTHREIADIIRCPLGTVKTHIARGKEKLRKQLGVHSTNHG